MVVIVNALMVKINRFPTGKSFPEEVIWILTNGGLEGPDEADISGGQPLIIWLFDISKVVLLYEPGKIKFTFIKVKLKLQLV